MSEYEAIKFRLYAMKCCGHMLCWVNPRPPTYCPSCGEHCYPDVNAWARIIVDNALLKLDKEGR